MSKFKNTSMNVPVTVLTTPLPTKEGLSVKNEWSYAGPKNGGTDVGNLVKDIESVEYIVKTGIGAGLLKQIAEKQAAGDVTKAKEYIGYNVGNYARLIGLSKEESKVNSPAWNDLLYAAFISYSSTTAGQSVFEAIRGKTRVVNGEDIHTMLDHMYKYDPKVKNILGLPAITDVLYGAISQRFIDNFQRTYLDPKQVPEASVVIDSKQRPYLASRYVGGAVGFDEYLSAPFFQVAGVESEFALQAGRTYDKALSNEKKVKKGNEGKPESEHKAYIWSDAELQAKAIVERITGALTAGKEALSVKIKASGGLKGFYESIILRLIMGESADLGPDNMLVADSKIINIDVTGCRYARAEDIPEFKDKGWKTILNPINTDVLQKNLLDKAVFKDRYLEGLPLVHLAIVEVLSQDIGQDKATEARENVLGYLSSLDPSLVTASIEALRANVEKEIPAERLPEENLMKSAIDRAKGFMTEAISFARSLSQAKELHLANSRS